MVCSMVSILSAIEHMAALPSYSLKQLYKNNNRIQRKGDPLEYFIKDAFCGTLSESDSTVVDTCYSEVFSYLGNANNPPDLMLRGGDAIEVKKIATLKAQISLNSSHPKNKLYSDDALLKKACRECEIWSEKDIIYAIGSVNDDNQLLSLWLVYGSVYAASKETYESMGNKIRESIRQHSYAELSATNELARVNKVDPLGITYLRVRGMWGIEHPSKVFDYLLSGDVSCIHALIPEEKYQSFERSQRQSIEVNPRIRVECVRVKYPDNPALRIDARHIMVMGVI